MDSLALFLAQLGAGHEKYQEQLYAFYAQSRGWVQKSEDLSHVFELIRDYNIKRWQQFRRKIFRESTHFAHIRNKDCDGIIDRCYNGVEFQSFLKNPDAIFNHPGATVLKAGNSATVVKVTLDSHELVIKRYNIKNMWHQLRRSVRATRAAKSWELAHKLNMFGVPTARPVAFIEKKLLGMRSQSYFISEYVSSEHIGEYFNRQRKDEVKTAVMIEKTANLLKLLQKLQMTHGDLKMTNILVNANEQPVLIDLDGAAEYFSMTALQRAWQRETDRLLRNFEDKPDLQEKFRSILV
jgi:tRNA A-37 threonylcarbamoyl transferase component Bud32